MLPQSPVLFNLMPSLPLVVDGGSHSSSISAPPTSSHGLHHLRRLPSFSHSHPNTSPLPSTFGKTHRHNGHCSWVRTSNRFTLKTSERVLLTYSRFCHLPNTLRIPLGLQLSPHSPIFPLLPPLSFFLPSFFSRLIHSIGTFFPLSRYLHTRTRLISKLSDEYLGPRTCQTEHSFFPPLVHLTLARNSRKERCKESKIQIVAHNMRLKTILISDRSRSE